MITLKQTLLDIKNDLQGKNKGVKNFIISYLYSPRFRILLNHRLGKLFFNSKLFLIRQLGYYYKARLVTKRSCDISYNAHIGSGLKMPHPIGIVIGEGVVIRNDVMIFQQVTLGSHGKKESASMEYPIVESGVKIFTGAKIIGGITIGANAIIGANSVVNINVPSDAVAVGIPCRIINKL
jgi:serine O-acetyltransferase